MTIAGAWMTGSSDCLSVLVSGMALAPKRSAEEPWLASDCADCLASDDQGFLAGDIRIDHRHGLARDAGVPDASSLTDAALFLHCWRRWGADLFERIEGEFAVAIWNSESRTLVLARDALGQRPLFFRRIGDGVAFASLPLPLAGLSGPTSPDLVRLAAYLMWLPDKTQRSFVEGVDRILPGHSLSITNGNAAEQRPWWTPDLQPLAIGRAEARARVDAELRHAVRGSLPTGGPVATDLTAGLDSSLVAVTAAAEIDDPRRLLAVTAVPGPPVDSPPDWPSDEASLAARTAAMNGLTHQVVRVPSESPFDALERWFESSQAPIANACNIGWLDACYAAARDCGAGTYLTGGRGNFTVSRPAMRRLSDLSGTLRLAALARELAAYRRFAGGSWPGLLAMAFGDLIPHRIWNFLAPARHRRARDRQIASMALLRPGAAVRDALSEFGDAGAIDVLFATESPAARRMVAQSIDDGSGNHAIRKAFGIEVREPLATRRMVELCMRLPTEIYFHDGRPRALARDLLKGRVPDEVADQRSRGWQGANWRAGFEPAIPEMLEEVDLIERHAELSAMFDAPRMRALLLAWPAGNWTDWDQIETYRHTLFRAIGAARFARFVREWVPVS
jgi:asparagine synthase (glutamine-hydrolysing)